MAGDEQDRTGATRGLLLAEYEQLKEEQRLRIGTRDNLVYATLCTLGLAVGGAMGMGRAEMLLLVPPACLALGWTYLSNDDRITAIGGHIRAVIIPELVRLGLPPAAIFSWEPRHRGDARRRRRKGIQLAVDLLVFTGPAVTALGVTWTLLAPSLPLAVASAAELLGTALLALQFVRHARQVSPEQIPQ
ncbi:hypothetical protein ACQP2K_25965 [Microbispora siamensis]